MKTDRLVIDEESQAGRIATLWIAIRRALRVHRALVKVEGARRYCAVCKCPEDDGPHYEECPLWPLAKLVEAQDARSVEPHEPLRAAPAAYSPAFHPQYEDDGAPDAIAELLHFKRRVERAQPIVDNMVNGLAVALQTAAESPDDLQEQRTALARARSMLPQIAAVRCLLHGGEPGPIDGSTPAAEIDRRIDDAQEVEVARMRAVATLALRAENASRARQGRSATGPLTWRQNDHSATLFIADTRPGLQFMASSKLPPGETGIIGVSVHALTIEAAQAEVERIVHAAGLADTAPARKPTAESAGPTP